jgi:hypothetical protein
MFNSTGSLVKVSDKDEPPAPIYVSYLPIPEVQFPYTTRENNKPFTVFIVYRSSKEL